MFINVAGTITVVCAMVVLQFFAQRLLAFSVIRRFWFVLSPSHQRLEAVHVIFYAILLLISCHLLQMGIWALFYHWVGHFPSFRDALYFSFMNFAGIGTDALVLNPPHRVLGPFERVVAMLMFGWSVALVVALVIRMGLLRIGGLRSTD